MRTLVVAALDLTRQLRERDDGHVQFLGERLQAGGDLGDFLNPIVGAPSRPLQQLNIIDHQQIEALLPLEPARARRELRDRKPAGFVDIEWQRLQLDRIIADFFEIALGDAAAADGARGIPVRSAMIRVASCSADISQEKKPTMPPLTDFMVPSA